MTLITKLGTFLFLSAMSLFILQKPPAPTPAQLTPAPVTVWQALEPDAPLPPTTVITTTTTPLNGCDAVYSMARHIGWPVDQLGMLVAVAQRESRCQADAFNAKDPNGGSYGIMQVNGFWAKKTTAYPNGYLQTMGVLTQVEQLFDLETNLRAALAIYQYSNGWRAWGR